MASSQQSDHTWTSGDFEHPNPQLRWSITVGLVFAFLLSTVAVGLRFLARRLAGGRLYLDDWLMLVALVCLRTTCCRSIFTDDHIANSTFQRFLNTDAQSESLHVSLYFTKNRKTDTYPANSPVQWPRFPHRYYPTEEPRMVFQGRELQAQTEIGINANPD